MDILKAAREDLARILEIQKICYAREAERAGDPDIEPMRQSLPELEAEYGKLLILKGVEDGSIVGSVRAALENGTCKIGRLVVPPERRCKGHGSALLRAIEAAFSSARRFELFTGSSSPDNIALYERSSYRQFSAKPVSGDYCLIYMEKPGPASTKELSLGIDFAGIGDHRAYRDFWKRLPRIEATMAKSTRNAGIPSEIRSSSMIPMTGRKGSAMPSATYSSSIFGDCP